jgi:hypothetical protein
MVQFWTDNWLGSPLVELLNLPHNVWPRLTAPVSSYVRHGAWHIPDCITEIDPSIAQQIKRVTLPIAALPDRLVWCDSVDGQLSAKHASQVLSTAATVSWAGWLWNKSVPPSNSFVVWRIIHNKMPTDDNLIHRGCIVVSVCPFCLSTYETTIHLFLSCSFALQLWNWLEGILECTLNTTSVLNLFEDLPHPWSALLLNLARASFIHVLHTIWMGRNGIRFNNCVINVHAAKMKILTSIATSAPLLDGHTTSATELLILSRFRIQPRLPRAPQHRLVLWKSPPIWWYKVNTDGSVMNNVAACGGIFRDHMANHVASFAQNIVMATVLYAEIMAIILALELAAIHSWSNIWVESDSTAALGAFDNPELVPWNLRNRWSNCFLRGLNIIHSHIFREGNACADSLANHGHGVEDSAWWDSLPLFLGDQFLYDKMGLPCYRTT